MNSVNRVKEKKEQANDSVLRDNCFSRNERNSPKYFPRFHETMQIRCQRFKLRSTRYRLPAKIVSIRY